MALLIDHLPASLHVVLITRSDPPLPLARLRAHNDLCELHSADLHFSLAETQAFLQALPFPIALEAIERLHERTEGWVAGLRLATLALQGQQDQRRIDHVLTTFAGSHQHIVEYLVADVLGAQPAEIQEFLLQTALLSRLSASLCDAVTGRHDSGLLLEQLERANLFLVPLDSERQWYRYHALFAEAMRHYARRRHRRSSRRRFRSPSGHGVPTIRRIGSANCWRSARWPPCGRPIIARHLPMRRRRSISCPSTRPIGVASVR